MATIILDSGEIFSHSHQDINESHCLKGLVEIKFKNNATILKAGDSISIPAGITHYLKNLGETKAYIGCAHAPDQSIIEKE